MRTMQTLQSNSYYNVQFAYTTIIIFCLARVIFMDDRKSQTVHTVNFFNSNAKFFNSNRLGDAQHTMLSHTLVCLVCFE